MNGAGVVAAARGWIGTPYQPNQRSKGLGVDCVGLVVGVALECGFASPWDVTLAYPLRANGQLRAELNSRLVAVPAALAGDVLLMAFSGDPHHLALSAGPTIIHAYAPAGRCLEQPMPAVWRSAVRGIYRFRELGA
jgi:cell wall-associated NlpC family hydrolase